MRIQFSHGKKRTAEDFRRDRDYDRNDRRGGDRDRNSDRDRGRSDRYGDRDRDRGSKRDYNNGSGGDFERKKFTGCFVCGSMDHKIRNGLFRTKYKK